jgi:RNA polymerase sigma factor (sigma-70 family)
MTVLAGWEAVEPRSDAELALAAAAGDRGAFACIYDRYAHRLHDFCIGMLGDREAAADCVQDAFCTAVTCLSDLREPDKLRSWLYAIVRSEALRRVRHNSREWTTDDVPEQASAEASPDTLAARMELADLIDAAAGGLSDRDRAVLELAFRQGLDGPELAVALGISLTNANTMVYRLRETIERSLGALLVSRRVRANPTLCPQLAVILADWDGQFTVLVRKRVARHIESCVRCDRDRRRLVSPAALLGAAPVLIPAPAWLRRRTMDKVRLTCTEADLDIPHPHSPPRRGRPNSAGARYLHGGERARTRGAPNVAAGHRRRPALLAALLIGVPFVILGTTIAWFTLPQLSVAPINATSQMVTPRSAAAPPPPAPARSITRPPAPPMTRPQQSRTAVPTVVLPRETVTSTAAPAPAPSDTEPSSPPPSPAPIASAPSLTITFAPQGAVAPPLQIPSLQIPSLPMPTIPMPTPRGAASTPAQQSAPPTTPAPNTADVPAPPAPAPTTSAVPVPVDPYPIIR